MEPLQSRGLDPEIVEVIDKAVRSSWIAAQSRPQGTGQRPGPAGGIGRIGVGVLVAAYTSMIGVVVWQGESIRSNMEAGFQAAQTDRLTQFEVLRSEISALRSDTKAEFDALRFEINAVRSETGASRSETKGEVGALRSETNADFGALRSEISTLRSETKAEFGELRSAISSLGERILRIENLIKDLLPFLAP